MNLDEVKKVLNQQLNQPLGNGKKRNIVFWYDEATEFVNDIDFLELTNATLLKLDDHNAFGIKYRIEKAEPETSFLVYAPFSKPEPRGNWLIDILKYSHEFSTDKTTVIMREMGVTGTKAIDLKAVFKKYLRFFNAKDRFNRFAAYGITDFNENRVHIAVLSALGKLGYPNFEEVLKALLVNSAADESALMDDICKFADYTELWRLIRERYGYHDSEESLEKFLIMLLVAHLESELKVKTFPVSWGNTQPFIETVDRNGLKVQKPDKDRIAAAVVFVNHFMNHEADGKYYDQLADSIESVLRVKDYLNGWNVEDYQYCDTFRVFDESIIDHIIGHLVDDTGEFDRYLSLVSSRRTAHWYKHYEPEYRALMHAIEILKLEASLKNCIHQKSSIEMIEQYTKEYCSFDFHYRKYCRAYQQMDRDSFTRLNDKIENTYVFWYLNELSNKWSASMAESIEKEYRIQGVAQQKDFFANVVQKHLKADERVFVIISDGLRYEAARELTDALNTEQRGQAELDYMQGVVPSYTRLGMASLLPYKRLVYSERCDVLADGISTNGTINRGKILAVADPSSLAVTYENLSGLKRNEFRELLTGKKLVYIYHDRIDNTGHNMESEVFESTDKAIDELKALVGSLVNNVSATNIYVTSDHGYIYQRTALSESDKASKGERNAKEEGKRFILTDENLKKEGCFTIPMDYILPDNGLNAVVPRGNVRFKVQGDGSRYAHEGIALQEIVIPLLKFKNIRKDEYTAKKVAVKLTSITRKLTNRISYLEFYQEEKLSEKVIARRLKLYFEDASGNRLSNENIIIADSGADSAEHRTFREKFTLKDLKFDKAQKYYLILEDEDEAVEKVYEKIAFNIDLVIADDFGF